MRLASTITGVLTAVSAMVIAPQVLAGVDLSQQAPVTGYSYRETQWWQGGAGNAPVISPQGSSAPTFVPSPTAVPSVGYSTQGVPSVLPSVGDAASVPSTVPSWMQQPSTVSPVMPQAVGVRVHVESNPTQALPGTSVQYAVTVTNATAVRLEGLTVAVQFDPSQQSVVDAPGAAQYSPGTLVWSGGIVQPGVSKTLTYTLAVPASIAGNKTLQSLVQVSGPQGMLAQSQVSLDVLRQLPVTGAGDYTSPLPSVSRFLTPIVTASALQAKGLPAWFWAVGAAVLLGIMAIAAHWRRRADVFA